MSAVSFATYEEASDKARLLAYFRERGRAALGELQREIGTRNANELAAAMNRAAKQSIKQVTDSIERSAAASHWTAEQTLSALLASTYAGQVAMLELRNEIRSYEYMDFSRRVGELWEDLIRLVFDHAPAGLYYFVPPLFSEVRSRLRQELADYIAALNLPDSEKAELSAYYEKVWVLVDSGEINLQLDLHFIHADERFNVDLKSGFGSNEKGNTNRLLMVATIYKNLPEAYRNILLVRSREEQNNHYFRALKDSGVWEAYCGSETYSRIKELTGFDIASWISTNVSWLADLSPAMVDHLRAHRLDIYLEW